MRAARWIVLLATVVPLSGRGLSLPPDELPRPREAGERGLSARSLSPSPPPLSPPAAGRGEESDADKLPRSREAGEAGRGESGVGTWKLPRPREAGERAGERGIGPRGTPLLLAAATRTPRPRPGRLPEAGADSSALRALHLLAAEDVDGARALLDALPEDASDPATRLARGVLRFFEQRYDDAIALMESARAGDPVGYIALARAAREVTKGDVRFEGEHFVVYHPPGKDAVLVPYLVDALERQRAVLGDRLGYLPAGKLAVEIVRDVRELARVTTLEEAEIRTTGTVAVCKFNKLMLLSPKALLKGYDWLDTAAHEYTHLVLTRKSRNQAPIWMQEGLAKWFEHAWRDGNEAPLSPVEAAMVRNAVEQGKLVTFEQMHPSLAKLPSQEQAALAYAEVVLAVEKIVARAGPKALPRILDLVAAGKDAGEAVAIALGMPFDRFLAEWRSYMATRPLPRGTDLHLRRLRFRDDPKQRGNWAEWAEIPDEKARGFARLGELLRARGRLAAAKVEYGKAYERVGPKVPILADQYALTAMMSGSEALAEKVLGEAIGWNPDYAALHVHLARLLVKRQDNEGAKEHLLAANRHDPFDPEIHAGLARALAALGDPAGASREEGFAKILSGHEGTP